MLTVANVNCLAKSQLVEIVNSKRHIERHMDDLSFDCKLCGKSFKTRIDLCHHNRTHKS